jgi:hypothetical protein
MTVHVAAPGDGRGPDATVFARKETWQDPE